MIVSVAVADAVLFLGPLLGIFFKRKVTSFGCDRVYGSLTEPGEDNNYTGDYRTIEIAC